MTDVSNQNNRSRQKPNRGQARDYSIRTQYAQSFDSATMQDTMVLESAAQNIQEYVDMLVTTWNANMPGYQFSTKDVENLSCHIGDIPVDYPAQVQLINTLAKTGKLIAFKVFRPLNPGVPRMFAVVTFSTLDEPKLIISKFNSMNWYNHRLRVTPFTMRSRQFYTGHTNIVVKNIPQTTPFSVLVETFEQFGQVLSCKMPENPNTNLPIGYAYINYVDPMSAERAIEEANNRQVAGVQLKVEKYISKPKENLGPRSLYIGFSMDVDETKVREYFEPYGTIVSLFIPEKKPDPKPRKGKADGDADIEEIRASMERVDVGGERKDRFVEKRNTPQALKVAFVNYDSTHSARSAIGAYKNLEIENGVLFVCYLRTKRELSILKRMNRRMNEAWSDPDPNVNGWTGVSIGHHDQHGSYGERRHRTHNTHGGGRVHNHRKVE